MIGDDSLVPPTWMKPPQPDTVRQWRDAYLAKFDAAKVGPTEEFRTKRRMVVENTFRWLESLAQSAGGA